MENPRSSNKSVKQVVLRDKQFSCYDSGVQPVNDVKAFKKSLEVAQTVLKGKDFTQGAKYYHEKSVKPYWRKSLSKVGEFGDHVFYKDIVIIKCTKSKKRHKFNRYAPSSEDQLLAVRRYYGRSRT